MSCLRINFAVQLEVADIVWSLTALKTNKCVFPCSTRLRQLDYHALSSDARDWLWCLLLDLRISLDLGLNPTQRTLYLHQLSMRLILFLISFLEFIFELLKKRFEVRELKFDSKVYMAYSFLSLRAL